MFPVKALRVVASSVCESSLEVSLNYLNSSINWHNEAIFISFGWVSRGMRKGGRGLKCCRHYNFRLKAFSLFHIFSPRLLLLYSMWKGMCILFILLLLKAEEKKKFSPFGAQARKEGKSIIILFSDIEWNRRVTYARRSNRVRMVNVVASTIFFSLICKVKTFLFSSLVRCENSRGAEGE